MGWSVLSVWIQLNKFNKEVSGTPFCSEYAASHMLWRPDGPHEDHMAALRAWLMALWGCIDTEPSAKCHQTDVMRDIYHHSLTDFHSEL